MMKIEAKLPRQRQWVSLEPEPRPNAGELGHIEVIIRRIWEVCPSWAIYYSGVDPNPV
jgi:hypothetical protein